MCFESKASHGKGCDCPVSDLHAMVHCDFVQIVNKALGLKERGK